MLNAKWKENSGTVEPVSMPIRTLCGINFLPSVLKIPIYTSLIPEEILLRYGLDLAPSNPNLDDYLKLICDPCSPVAEMSVYHQPGFRDPVLQGQICDTINGQLHVLFYALNDPNSPRFDVDCLPDGTSTELGTQCRNLEAETAAMQAGLAPGQVRSGLRLLNSVIDTFERFVDSLDQELYFAQPLYYHNAVIFERYGFSYAKGRRMMERIQQGFSEGGEFITKLNGSTPFRMPEAVSSIRLRSWALHDGLLDEPFTDVTMYKMVGRQNSIDTCPGSRW